MKKQRMEIKIDGICTAITVNNVIRMMNKIPFVQTDGIYYVNGSYAAFVYVSAPKIMKTYLEKKVTARGYKFVWL